MPSLRGSEHCERNAALREVGRAASAERPWQAECCYRAPAGPGLTGITDEQTDYFDFCLPKEKWEYLNVNRQLSEI